jgi:hypothetical protein
MKLVQNWCPDCKEFNNECKKTVQTGNYTCERCGKNICEASVSNLCGTCQFKYQ